MQTPQQQTADPGAAQPLIDVTLAPEEDIFFNQFDPYNDEILSWNASGADSDGAFSMPLLSTQLDAAGSAYSSNESDVFFDPNYFNTDK